MVWKTWSPRDSRPSSTPAYQPITAPAAYVTEKEVIPLSYVTNPLLRAAYDQMRQLNTMPQNQDSFDMYLGLPFTKGMTSRKTGQTLLIGSHAHHIDAGGAIFKDVTKIGRKKNYGDTIRWFNAGDLKTGFIGLDYRADAGTTAGVARSKADVTFLATTLLDLGYDPKKRLFLLTPPYIIESPQGARFRKQGLETLVNWK
jgi:hypothetical protein